MVWMLLASFTLDWVRCQPTRFNQVQLPFATFVGAAVATRYT